MIQRLVWNFEFSSKKPLPLTDRVSDKDDSIKWETRFFWPEDQIISLCNIDDSLLDLRNYHQKHKEDYYHLLDDCHYNIKRRHQELLYKPIIKQSHYALGYGAKINLDKPDNSPSEERENIAFLQKKVNQTHNEGHIIFVKKEAFIYKFPSTPSTKLELARLEVNNQIHFSACIEGKSLHLVEMISEHLLGKHVSCDYVTFLKRILK